MLMKNKLYNNADSFAMSFDEEWEILIVKIKIKNRKSY